MTSNRKTAKDRGQLPQPQKLEFPESEFSRFWKSKLVELDQAKRQHEERWGVGRVINLVDVEFRIKVWTQMERVWQAGASESVERARSAVDGMIRAYRAMDAWATAEGIAPAGEAVKAIEWEAPDGTIMAVVQTEADAVVYQEARKDVQNRHIWSMGELALLMEKGIAQDVAQIKAQVKMPATLVKVENKANLTGFEDMENDLDMTEPDELPKMFNTKAAESLRKRENRLG
jgi:hypothetical protein